MTVRPLVPTRSAVDDAAARLAAAGVPSPRFDAEELAAFLLGTDRSAVVTAAALDRAAYDRLVARRAAREPLQHITGVAHFRYLTLAVGRGVFIPRPETECVVGYAIEWLRGHPVQAPVCVDLCAGSGAIAAALATEIEGSVVHAVELSADALPWLRRNVEPLGVVVHHADVANAMTELDGRVDAVVCNPPYIPDDAVPRDPEVVDHDPALALWGGPDGLDVLRVVERTAARLLRPGGLLVIEHADVQGETVPGLLAGTRDWQDVRDHADLTGLPRYTSAVRSAR
jgi:release factor glutamine methyltransferase